MQEFIIGLGIAFVIEGILWAGFPNSMKKAALLAIASPDSKLRLTGLLIAAFGLMLVSLIKG